MTRAACGARAPWADLPWSHVLGASILGAGVLWTGPLPADVRYPATVIILDSSGSMAAALEGETRLDKARAVVARQIKDWPPNRPIALVAYGHRRAGDCADIETLSPLKPAAQLDAPATMARLRARGKTPLSGALRHAAGLLPAEGGNLLLVSDGLETCHDDPCAVAAALRAAKVSLRIDVIGFGLSDKDHAALACIAKRGGGAAAAAATGSELARAIASVEKQVPQAAAPAVEPGPLPAASAPTPAPPPGPRPVLLRAELAGGAQAMLRPLLWTIASTNGFHHEGSGGELLLPMAPGAYRVRLSLANGAEDREISVPDTAAPALTLPVRAGLLTLRLTAAKGLTLEDAGLRGAIDWSLVPLDGQGEAVLTPGPVVETLLLPGRYRVSAKVAGFTAERDIAISDGMALQADLSLALGKLRLAARLPGQKQPLGGTAVSWRVSAPDGQLVARADAEAQPVLALPAGQYRVSARIAGLSLAGEGNVAEGETTPIVLELPVVPVAFQGALAPGAPTFTDWRDASWTVAPSSALLGFGAEVALTDHAEARPKLDLLAGDWQVTLKSGGAVATRVVTLTPDSGPHSVRVDLDAARLSMAVTARDGPPPVNAVLSVWPEGADINQPPTFTGGTASELSHILPAGRWQVTALDERGRSAKSVVILEPGDEKRLSLELVP